MTIETIVTIILPQVKQTDDSLFIHNILATSLGVLWFSVSFVVLAFCKYGQLAVYTNFSLLQASMTMSSNYRISTYLQLPVLILPVWVMCDSVYWQKLLLLMYTDHA